MALSNQSETLGSGCFVYTIHSIIALEAKQFFEGFQGKMNDEALRFEGYRGQSISYKEIDDGKHLEATTRIVFEDIGQCLSWLDSPERRRLLRQAETSMNYRYRAKLEADSFDQWIQVRRPEKVPIWKVNVLVWLALYPSVMVLTLLGSSTLGKMPLPLNMLISNGITVALTGFCLVPWLSRLYGGWLETSSSRITWLGLASVVAIQLILLGVFSRLPGTPWHTSGIGSPELVLNAF